MNEAVQESEEATGSSQDEAQGPGNPPQGEKGANAPHPNLPQTNPLGMRQAAMQAMIDDRRREAAEKTRPMETGVVSRERLENDDPDDMFVELTEPAETQSQPQGQPAAQQPPVQTQRQPQQQPRQQPVAATAPDNVSTNVDASHYDLSEYIEMVDGAPHFKMKVNGKKQFLPLNQTHRALQKSAGADARFYELNQRAMLLDRREAEINAKLSQASAPAERSEPRTSPSQKPEEFVEFEESGNDSDDQVVRKAVEKAFNNFIEGDTEATVEEFTKLLGKRKTPQLKVEGIEKLVDRKTQEAAKAIERQMQINRQIDAGYAVFYERYPKIAGDKTLFGIADRLCGELGRENPSWSIEQVMLEAGRRTEEWVNNVLSGGGQQPPPDNVVQLNQGNRSSSNDRNNRKENLVPVVPRHTSAVEPTEPEYKPQSYDEVLAMMKRHRGQQVG